MEKETFPFALGTYPSSKKRLSTPNGISSLAEKNYVYRKEYRVLAGIP